MDEPDTQSPGASSQIGRYGSYGITLGIAIVLFAWLGSLADERLGTKPWFTLLGTFGGFAAGFTRMYRDLMAGQRDSDANPDDEAGGVR